MKKLSVFVLVIILFHVSGCEKKLDPLSDTAWRNEDYALTWTFTEASVLEIKQEGNYLVDYEKKLLFLSNSEDFSSVLPYNYLISDDSIKLWQEGYDGIGVEDSEWELEHVSGDNVFIDITLHSGVFRVQNNGNVEVVFSEDGTYQITTYEKYSIRNDVIRIKKIPQINYKYFINLESGNLILMIDNDIYMELKKIE